MNIAYFRKTDKTMEAAVAAVKTGLAKRGFATVGEHALPSGSVIVQFWNASAGDILASDRTLLGLVPMSVMIERKDGVSIGIMNPDLLKGAPGMEGSAGAGERLAKEMKVFVNEAAGVGEPKVEKVTMYSTATCPYCRMEKDYLEKHNVSFATVMVDSDRKAAQEMIQKSGQMGVPQTEITYDDGDFEIVMGFDKDRLNQLLGLSR